jgi:hypothetical protein
MAHEAENHQAHDRDLSGQSRFLPEPGSSAARGGCFVPSDMRSAKTRRSSGRFSIRAPSASVRTAGSGGSYTITVGSGVWIGARSTVLRDTVIADGSVVAACACVIGDVPADTLVAGVPARVMKEFGDRATETDQEPGR